MVQHIKKWSAIKMAFWSLFTTRVINNDYVQLAASKQPSSFTQLQARKLHYS